MKWAIPPFKLQDIKNASSRVLSANSNVKRYSVTFNKELDLGELQVGVPGFTWVELTNNGLFPTEITRIGLSAPFSLSGDTSGYLKPGESLKMKLSCTMSRVGPLTFDLLVYTDQKQFSFNVSVVGIPRVGSFPPNLYPSWYHVR